MVTGRSYDQESYSISVLLFYIAICSFYHCGRSYDHVVLLSVFVFSYRGRSYDHGAT